MTVERKYWLVLLLALMPVSIGALAWAVLNWASGGTDTITLALGVSLTAAAARLRIRLPRSSSHLALSDALVLFSLLYFGGEFAVLTGTSAAIASGLWQLRIATKRQILTNVCISI